MLPQQALHPCEQFARVEGLGHIVVRTDLQSDHLVNIVAAAGHENDADGRIARPQVTRKRQTVLAWQVDVEQHHIDPLSRHALPQPLAIVRRQRPVALLREVRAQAGLCDQIVIDDQQSGAASVLGVLHVQLTKSVVFGLSWI